MAGVNELGRDTLAQLHRLAVLTLGQKLRHTHGIGHGIDGLHQGAAGTGVFLILILGVTLLNVGRILQHNIQQVRRQAGGHDTAGKALLDEHGHAAGMVDMGVGHQHIVDGVGGKGQ